MSSIPVIGSQEKTTDVSQYGQTAEELIGLIATFGHMRFEAPSDIRDPNFVKEAKALLIEQFKRLPNVNSLVDIFVKPIQEIENTAAELYKMRSIATAAGVQLDGIGEIVGEPRNGLLDNEYRSLILTKIFLNASCGQAEFIITFILKTTDSPTVIISEYYPATLRIEINADTIPAGFYSRLKRSIAAGVNLDLINFSGDGVPFMFDLTGADPTTYADGFADLSDDPLIGGQFLESIN